MATWQSYDPKSSKLTTHSGATSSSPVASVSYVNSGTGKAPGAGTQIPGNTAQSGKPTFYNDMGQLIHGDDPNYDAYRSQLEKNEGSSAYSRNTGLAQQTAQEHPYVGSGPGGAPLGNQASIKNESIDKTGSAQAPAAPVDPAAASDPTILALLSSGREFSETDAKNYAYSIGESNWQQFIGAAGGANNPFYIGPKSFQELQKRYTSYQLEKATIRNQHGIYWNPEVNISDFPAVDPSQQANEDARLLAGVINSAVGASDPTVSDKAKEEDMTDPKNIMKQLQEDFGQSAEEIYQELFSSKEMEKAEKEVLDLKNKLEEFDDQIDDLKDDIRREVEGEASDSYISALATLRGEKILKQKRLVQREYDTAVAVYTSLREEALNIYNARAKDSDTRYTRLFGMLQLQLQQEGVAFNQQMALAQIMLQLPENRTITLPDGSVVKGLKENDNLNVVEFTDANRNVYVIATDKKTGAEVYRTLLGTAPSPVGSTVNNNYQYELKETEAKYALENMKDFQDRIKRPVTEEGSIRSSLDAENKTFYYDAYALDQAEKNKAWWRNDKLDPIDHLLYYPN